MIEKKEIDIIFYKLFIRSYLGKKKKKRGNRELLLLELLRNEIQIIILTTIISQVKRMVDESIYVGNDCKSDETIDLFVKLVLISAKNQILAYTYYLFPRSIDILAISPLRNLIEPEDINAFAMLLKNIANYSRYHFPIEVLIQHIVLRLSNIVIYELFLSKKIIDISVDPVEIYSIDPFLFFSYQKKVTFYMVAKFYLKSKLIRIYRNRISKSFLVFTRTGITLRNIILEKFFLSDPNIIGFVIERSLKLAEILMLYLIQFFSKR